MADVGVLNLKVNAEGSDKATQSLRQLAGALYRVKNAVSGGIHLGNVGKQIQDLAVKVDAYIGKGTISKINQLGEALQRLQNIGNLNNVTINIKDGKVTSVKEKVDQLKDTIENGIFQNAEKDAHTLSAGLEETKGRIDDLKNAADENILESVEEDTQSATKSIFNFEEEIERLKKEINQHEDIKLLEDLKGRLSEQEISAIETRIESLTKRIEALKKIASFDGLLEKLNNPSGLTSYKGYNDIIDRSLGIKDSYKSAKESAAVIAKLMDKQDQTMEKTAIKSLVRLKGIEDEENERLRNIKNASLVYEKGDFFELPKGSDHPGRTQPTDLINNNDNPQAWALLGLLGEKQQIGAIADEVHGTGQSFEEVRARIEEAKAALGDAMPVVRGFGHAVSEVQDAGTKQISAQDLVDMSQADLLTMKMEGMKQALQSDIEENKLSAQQMADRAMQIQKLSDKIDGMTNVQEEATEQTHRFRDAMEDIKKAASHSHIGKLVNQFMRMAKLRAIRYVIKEISSGFSEGLENVYKYSEAITGPFAASMDSAASSMLTMKNSLGAAVAPLIQMLIPYLQIAVNWFISLVNYANQFFALMNGQSTWTHAVPATAQAFEDQENAAHGAANAVKDLLADWDELNIIQSETGGGGGSGSASAAEDYLNMFEEVATFDNRIKKIFDFLKDNMNELAVIAAGIGATLLGWKLSSTFMETLPWLAKIGTGLAAAGVITIALGLTDLSGQKFAQSGDVGWFLLDALGGAVGAELAGELVKKIAGGAAGQVTKGFTLILEGAINIKNSIGAAEQMQKGRAWALTALGAVEIGVGSALAAAGFGAGLAVSFATGAVAGVAALTIGAAIMLEAYKKASYRQMAVDAFAAVSESGISAQEYIAALQKRLDELTKGSSLVVNTTLKLGEHEDGLNNAIESLKTLNGLVGGEGKLKPEDAQAFKEAWDIVINEMGEISKINYQTIYAGLDEAIKSGSETIREQALELRKEAIRAEGIMNGARAAMEKEMSFLVNAISTGAATDEDIARYKELYKALAEETEDGLAGFRQKLKEGAVFDFSGEENPIEAAKAFIQSMGTDAVQPALDAVQAQYDATVSSVKAQQEELERMHAAKYINDDQYNEMKAFYEETISVAEKRLEEQKKEINQSVAEAINTIAKQAVAGYLSLDGSESYEQMRGYADAVLIPLMNAIQDAFGPEALQSILTSGEAGGFADFLDLYLKNQIRDQNVVMFNELETQGKSLWSQLPNVWKDALIDNMNDMFGPDVTNALVEAWDATSDWANQWHAEGSGDVLPEIEYDAEVVEDPSLNTPIQAPGIDNTEFNQTLNERVNAAAEAARQIQDYLSIMGGFAPMTGPMSGYRESARPVIGRAAGGAVRSGDLVMANENGNFEMMGRMGHQPVVANNQQIVDGISRGVTNANGNVVTEMRTMVTLMQRLLNKEIVAKAVPSSGWGRNNSKSAEAYSKVTG